MNVGDKVVVPFGTGTKEGQVVRLNEKGVWVKVDFPRHPGKLIRRKVHQLQEAGARPARKRRKAEK
jgi:hypothetical protein